MKKFVSFILVLIFAFSISACGKEKTKNISEKKSENVAVNTNTIDYDLSKLSTTMAYSQIAEMTQNSSKYLGKRIKMTGKFLVQETPNRNYYACHVSDTTACCSIGLEFVLKDTSLAYPTDYPKVNDTITVEGKFNSYKEGNDTFYELIDAVLIK